MPSYSLRSLVLALFFAAVISQIVRDRIDARPLAYEDYSKPKLQAHLDSGHCVLVSIYANWTLSTANPLSGKSHALTRQMRKHGVIPMLADWSTNSPPVDELMNELKLASVPLIAIYDYKNPRNPIVSNNSIVEDELVSAICQCGQGEDRTTQ